jgi:hypothetical protein
MVRTLYALRYCESKPHFDILAVSGTDLSDDACTWKRVVRADRIFADSYVCLYRRPLEKKFDAISYLL